MLPIMQRSGNAEKRRKKNQNKTKKPNNVKSKYHLWDNSYPVSD